MLSPVNIATKPSAQVGTSNNSSFDPGCFSFEENGSNLYALVGPDGQLATSFLKIGEGHLQLVTPKGGAPPQDLNSLLRQGSRLVLLENSLEQDVDEESHEDEDGSSLEEIKLDEAQRQLQEKQRRSKKQRQLRNHILIFKNPKELLDKERVAADASPLLAQRYQAEQQMRRISLETVLDEDIDEGKQSTVTEFKSAHDQTDVFSQTLKLGRQQKVYLRLPQGYQEKTSPVTVMAQKALRPPGSPKVTASQARLEGLPLIK